MLASKGDTKAFVFSGSPIFATIGTIGYQLANELRPGSQHSHKEAVAFVQRVIEMAKKLSGKPLLIRMDSAHDADEMLVELFRHANVHFIIKRNPRGEDPQKVYDWIKSSGAHVQHTSDRTERYTGTIAHKKTLNTQQHPLFLAFEYDMTNINDLFKYETRLASYWTNLPSDADEIIELYHRHATSEPSKSSNSALVD